MKTLIKDECPQEVWRVKDALGAKHKYDIDAIFRELREWEKTSGRHYVDLNKPQQKTSVKKKAA